MTDGVRIRSAEPSDEPAVTERLLRLGYESSEAVAPEFNALDDDRVAAADASRWLDHDDRAILVAERDGRLVGYVSGVTSDAPAIYDRGAQLHVDGLYVVPAARREGVAEGLLERIERWADDRGCEYVGVTVHVDNDAARALYEDRYDRTFYSYRRRLDEL